MAKHDSAVQIKRALLPLFKVEPKIGFAYLFGSRAQGIAGTRSDYDVAIYFDESDVIKRHDLLFRLAGLISQKFKTDLIDVHSINDLQAPELKFSIIHDGILLFEREPHRVLAEPRILNEYFDFMYLSKKYNFIHT